MGTYPAAAQVNVANFVSAKLRGDENWNNYKSWKVQMLCLVESQGLVEFIHGEDPLPQNDDEAAWRRTDWLVKGWILGALSDEVINNVANLDSATARVVWSDLESMFPQSQPPPHGYPPSPPHLPPPPVHVGQRDWNEYLPLYKAIMRGERETTKQIMQQDTYAVDATVAFTLETALHVAVGNGKSKELVSELVNLMTNEQLATRDELGNNALHVAALTGNYDAAKILIERSPDLLYCSDNVGWFPVHIAAAEGHRETLQLLIFHTRDDYHLPTSPFAGESGLMLLNFFINANLLDMALDLVDKYPYLARIRHSSGRSALKTIAAKAKAFSVDNQLNFWERLLYSCIKVEMESHVQTSLGKVLRWRKLHFSIWKIIKDLVPCANRIHEKKMTRLQALRLVKCLCKHMESLNYVEASSIYEGAMTAAAEAGTHEVIEVIVGTFPPAIYSKDYATGQNFLHMAVKNRCEKVFNLIYQTGNHKHQYANKTDNCGNSILHMAARLAPPHKLSLVSGAALQMQREIQWFREVRKLVSPFVRGMPNHAREIPEMIFTEEHRELKIEGEKWMKDTANSCTIAAALIVTVVFAAAITVPGGNESEGYPMFFKASAFIIFAVSDAISLFTSTTSLLMFLSILTSRYAERDFLYALPKRLCIGLFTLFLSILFMMIAFSSTLYLVFGRKKAWVLLPVGALTCLPVSSFVLLQFPLLIDVFSSTYGRGIFVKQSDRPFH